MEQTTPITISKRDFDQLLNLVRNLKSNSAELLEEEISRASVVSDDALHDKVVSMHSTVQFVDETTGAESVVTLVYPQEANIDEGKLSILAPVGIALIGLRVGQNIQWPMPHGNSRSLRVVSVTQSRERSNTA